MEALSREDLAFGTAPRTAPVRRRLGAVPKALSEGYPPAPPLAESSRLSTLVEGPRHLLGSAVVALFAVKPALRQMTPSHRPAPVQQSQQPAPSRLNP